MFSYLIVPGLAGIILGNGIGSRLFIGWGFGTGVSVLAMLASAVLDLPTGATVVCAFGVILLALGGFMKATAYHARVVGSAAAPNVRSGAG